MSNSDALHWFIFLLATSLFLYFVSFSYISFSPSSGLGSDRVVYERKPLVSSDEAKEVRAVSMAFVGDIMMDRGIRSVVHIRGGGDYGYITRYLDFLHDFDVVFGNLEGPLSDKGSDLGGPYSFRMEPSALDALLDANFSVLSVANNHSGDWGRDAFSDTLKRLRSAGVLTVGGGVDIQDAQKVSVTEVDGYKLGFVGFTDIGPDWLEAGEDTPGILLAGSSYHDAVIERASREVDVLIVSYHFGEEYMKVPNERQRYLATRAVDLGADIVVGHHPHVIQEVERYKEGLIAFSLGNFIFDQNFSEETMEGLVLIVDIVGGEINYRTKEVEITDRFQPRLRPKDVLTLF